MSEKEVWVNKGEAVRILGVSRTQIARYEEEGKLTTRKNAAGWKEFDRTELVALARERGLSGAKQRRKTTLTRESVGDNGATIQEEQQITRGLEQGLSLLQCAQQFGIRLTVVQSVARDYATLKDTLLMGPEAMRILNSLPLEGVLPFTNDVDLAEAVRKAIESDTCHGCKRQPRYLCRGCVKRHVDKRVAEHVKEVEKLAAI
jgi:Zn-finger nucleic acid-binding protein